MEIRPCRTIGTPNSEFGEYSVEGDPTTSRIFAQNNAKLPLLSLRFEPANPIDAPDVIGNSLQQLRELNQSDQALLAEFADAYANWEAFLSYSHRDHVAADDLTSDLERSGIKTFHDSKSLKGGDFWWSEILKAIEKAKCLIVVVGKDTSSSE